MSTSLIFENQTNIQLVEQSSLTIPDTVNAELLKKHDPKPVFVKMKIGKIDAESHNYTSSGKPRRYGLEAWQSIVSFINRGLVTGQMGHRESWEWNTFKKPVIYWVKAAIEANQEVSAVAYLPPGDGRDHYLSLSALGQPAATSLHATGSENDDGSIDIYQLEQIDIVPAVRAGLVDAIDDSPQFIMTESIDENGDTVHIMRIQDQATFERIKAILELASEEPETIEEAVSLPGELANFPKKSEQKTKPAKLDIEESVLIPGDMYFSETTDSDDDNPAVLIPGDI